MHIENLVKMANDIAAFFDSEPDQGAAIAGIADHIKRFWDPRMRRAIVEHNRVGAFGLSESARLAIARLDQESHSLSECGDG